MPKPAYFRWNPAEAEADEDWRMMDVSQIGLFMVLLNYGWNNKGIPIDPFDIWRVIPLKIDRKLFDKLWVGLVESKFPIEGDRRHNHRQEIERYLAEQVSNSRAEAARAKHKKTMEGGSANAEQMPAIAEQTHLHSYLDLSSKKGSAEGKQKRRPDDLDTVTARLAGNPAWKGIDVATEAAKCAAWCQVNARVFSERRLVNWLNRIEKPIPNGNGHAAVRAASRVNEIAPVRTKTREEML